MHFDGVQSFVQVEDDASRRVSALTVAVWYQPQLPVEERLRWMPLVDRMNAFVPDGFRLHVSVDGMMASVATSPGGSLVELFEAPCRFTPGEWRHVAFTFDGAALVAYLDGQCIGSQTAEAPGAIWYGTLKTPVGIGARATGPTSHLCGALEDVRVWDRALTPEQVAAVRRGE